MQVNQRKMNEMWKKAEEAAKLYEAMVNDYIYLSKKGLKREAKRLEVKVLAVRKVAKELIERAQKASVGRKHEKDSPTKGPGPDLKYHGYLK